ncbi:MAG: alpha/beta hydrolase [Caulobacter sp.]|nr:alpha/beta hydrolase [Caulobacter sp.]
MTRLLLPIILLLGLAAPAFAQDPANPFNAPGEPVVIGQGYDLPSTILGQTRRINIQLPPGYDALENRDRRYPVLYLLDGGVEQQDFFHIAGLLHQGGLWGINAPVILVGVASDDRRAELTLPAARKDEREAYPTHGKADSFRRFLVEELQPRVNAAYRTDGTDGLIGESLAALFVVDVALRHPADFDRYIAISPSLWWDNQATARLAPELLATPGRPKIKLWLSIADEGGQMQGGMDRLVAALKRNPGGVDWTYRPYPSEKHSTIYHPAATRAIRDLFPPPAAKD